MLYCINRFLIKGVSVGEKESELNKRNNAYKEKELTSFACE